MHTMTAEAFSFTEEFADSAAIESELQLDFIDRYRKVTVGPSASLVFENASTLQFRVQEVQKLQRIYPPASVHRMLDWYRSLLPSSGRLSAAVSVRRPGRRPSPGLNGLADAVAKGKIALRIGDLTVPGTFKPTRAGDRILGPAFWVTFTFNDASLAALQDFTIPATVYVDAEGYSWESDSLAYDVRRSLCDDFGRFS